MNKPSKKSCAWALILVALGLLALFGDTRWLLVLIPTAAVVCYAAAITTFKKTELTKDGR
jgi:hypothetical protein